MKTAAALSMAALACGMVATDARAEWIADAEATFVYDDNVSRAQRESDIHSDSTLLLRAGGGYYFQLTDRTGATIGANVQRSHYARYSGLSSTGIGPNASVRTKLGLGADAPWIRLSGSALRLEFDNDIRTGWLFTLAGAAGVRVSERIDLRTELRLERSRADRTQALVPNIPGDAYDLDSVSVAFGGDYAITRDTSVALAYTYRTGDVVSSTRRNRAIFTVSSAIAPDPAFGPDIIAYKLDAQSHVFDVRLSHALGNRASVNLGFGRSLTYGDGGNNYYSSSVSASLLYNF